MKKLVEMFYREKQKVIHLWRIECYKSLVSKNCVTIASVKSTARETAPFSAKKKRENKASKKEIVCMQGLCFAFYKYKCKFMLQKNINEGICFYNCKCSPTEEYNLQLFQIPSFLLHHQVYLPHCHCRLKLHHSFGHSRFFFAQQQIDLLSFFDFWKRCIEVIKLAVKIIKLELSRNK